MKYVFILTFISSLSVSQELNKNLVIESKAYQKIQYIFCSKVECPDQLSINGKKHFFKRHSLNPTDLKAYNFRRKMSFKIDNDKTIESYGLFQTIKDETGTKNIEYFNFIFKTEATISVCDQYAISKIGCADKIIIDNNETNVDLSRVTIPDFLKRGGKSQDVFVIGYYTYSDGHQPNKQEMQHIFIVSSIIFDPKLIDSKVNNLAREIIKNKEEDLGKDRFVPSTKK